MSAKKVFFTWFILAAVIFAAILVVKNMASSSAVMDKLEAKSPAAAKALNAIPNIQIPKITPPAGMLSSLTGDNSAVSKVLASVPGVKNLLSAKSANSVDIPPYWLQAGTPSYVPNFAHPEQGCNWFGVVGQVFDAKGNPSSNMVVNIGGTLNSTQVSALGLTGTGRIYGLQGYEVELGKKPVDSSGTLWVQLTDQKGNPMSQKINLNTYSDCQKNLILVNFIYVPGPYKHVFMPMVSSAGN